MPVRSSYGNPAGPATGAAAVTPSDSAAVDFAALWIGGAGNVAVTTAQGQTVTFTGVTAGYILPINCTKVLATGTTATNIVGLS